MKDGSEHGCTSELTVDRGTSCGLADFPIIEYPSPVFIPSTFLANRRERVPSDQGWPPTLESREGSEDCLAGFRPYCAGEVLKRTALLGPELVPTSVSNIPPAHSEVMPHRRDNVDCNAPQEPISQCSTVDTAYSACEAVDPTMLTPLSRSCKGHRDFEDDSPRSSTPVRDIEGYPPEIEWPSAGSQVHYEGQCKPCAFVFKDEGCKDGKGCLFCHLCPRDEKKQRKRQKKQYQKLKQANARQTLRSLRTIYLPTPWL
mmetsp:Transcript_43389/g.68707  ORF Transcript_43389/g.68707 Transcript_43389/m.68707 type:complete len:258 (-) Transcript_43389:157-930(-)